MDREEKDTTEEVEELAAKLRVREDQPDSDSVADDASGEGDDDSDVDEQMRMSDATLKHAIERIVDALAKLV